MALTNAHRARVARLEALIPPRPPGGRTIGDMPHADIIVRLVAVLLDPDASPEEQNLAAFKAHALRCSDDQHHTGDQHDLDHIAWCERRENLEPDEQWRAEVARCIASGGNHGA